MDLPPISSPLAPAPNSEPAPFIAEPPHVSNLPKNGYLLALIILGLYPVWTLALRRNMGSGKTASSEAVLPSDIPSLLLVTSIELAIFAAFCTVAWLLARPRLRGDDLFLRWQGGWKPVAQGVFYSLAIRLGIGLIAFVILTAAAIVLVGSGTMTMEEFPKLVKKLVPSPERMINIKAISEDPLYRLVMATYISFIVAGLREELWRAGMLALGISLLRSPLSPRVATLLAILGSSLIFGLGHLYQGGLAVGITAIIGVILGYIMLYHRSIWPAVIAHGCFDALSFLMLPMAKAAIER